MPGPAIPETSDCCRSRSCKTVKLVVETSTIRPHECMIESVTTRHPSFIVAHKLLFCQTAVRRRVSLVLITGLPPLGCIAAGGSGVVLMATVCSEELMFEPTLPVIAITVNVALVG